MKVRLSRELITKLYFYLFQAERSIDKVLGNNWSDFLAYYNPEKVMAIQEVIRCVGSLLEQRGIAPFSFDRAEVARKYPEIGIFNYFFGKRIGRWKKGWSLPSRELCYMATSLKAVLPLLCLPTKPDLTVLVSLRMDLCFCRSIIEVRCRGLPILNYGVRIEHLYQSEWIAPASLADILETKTRPDQLYRDSYLQRRQPLGHANR